MTDEGSESRGFGTVHPACSDEASVGSSIISQSRTIWAISPLLCSSESPEEPISRGLLKARYLGSGPDSLNRPGETTMTRPAAIKGKPDTVHGLLDSKADNG